ncbi:hypothetical protein ACVIRO_001240 [Rhizobium ruizarguesonis]
MTDFHPAKRGFIAITTKAKRSNSMLTGMGLYLDVKVGTVDSVTRDGTVKAVRPATLGNAVMKPSEWDEVIILDPAKLKDADGFLDECRKRQTPDPDTWRPFESVEDVRQTAVQFR